MKCHENKTPEHTLGGPDCIAFTRTLPTTKIKCEDLMSEAKTFLFGNESVN